MSYLANSPLKYLKDNDVILMLLEYVEKTPEYCKIYHINLQKKKIHYNNLNWKKKCDINKIFGWIYQYHLRNASIPNPTYGLRSQMEALIPSSYPFYRNPKTNLLDVKNAVKVYEISMIESREYRKYHPSGGPIWYF